MKLLSFLKPLTDKVENTLKKKRIASNPSTSNRQNYIRGKLNKSRKNTFTFRGKKDRILSPNESIDDWEQQPLLPVAASSSQASLTNPSSSLSQSDFSSFPASSARSSPLPRIPPFSFQRSASTRSASTEAFCNFPLGFSSPCPSYSASLRSSPTPASSRRSSLSPSLSPPSVSSHQSSLLPSSSQSSSSHHLLVSVVNPPAQVTVHLTIEGPDATSSNGRCLLEDITFTANVSNLCDDFEKALEGRLFMYHLWFRVREEMCFLREEKDWDRLAKEISRGRVYYQGALSGSILRINGTIVDACMNWDSGIFR